MQLCFCRYTYIATDTEAPAPAPAAIYTTIGNSGLETDADADADTDGDGGSKGHTIRYDTTWHVVICHPMLCYSHDREGDLSNHTQAPRPALALYTTPRSYAQHTYSSAQSSAQQRCASIFQKPKLRNKFIDSTFCGTFLLAGLVDIAIDIIPYYTIPSTHSNYPLAKEEERVPAVSCPSRKTTYVRAYIRS